jgi:hypothetical protein
MPNEQQSIKALEALILGQITPEEYNAALLSGKISEPDDKVWLAIRKQNAMPKEDIDTAKGGALERGVDWRTRTNRNIKLPEQEVLDQGNRFHTERTRAAEAEETARLEAESKLPLEEFLAQDASSTPFEDPEAEFATVRDETGALVSGPAVDGIATAPPPTEAPVIDFTPITLPNGDVHYRVKDMQTGEVTLLNPADLEQTKLALDVVKAGLAETNARITVAGEELDLKQNQFALETMLSLQGLQTAQRQLELSENRLELERELGKDRIALEEQALLTEQGPGAAAIAQAIQAGAESIDTSGVINVGGKPVDFEISDAVLDFFNLGGESKVNLQPARASQLTDDLSLGTRGATPLGEDVPLKNEILGRPASTGKLGELRSDIPLAAAFQALDAGDRNSVQQISNVLGLDLTKKLQEQSVPSGRGVFAQFRRN